MALQFAWLAGILFLGPGQATQAIHGFQCFDTPQTTADRSSLTITIGRINWVSHSLLDAISELALRELLGFTVARASLPDSWSFGTALASGLADTDLEQWTNPFGDEQYRDYISTTRQVHDLGTIGYVGRSAMWTLKAAVQRNRFADYYKFYLNETAARAAGFLSFAESGDAPGDTYCEPDSAAPWCEESMLEGYWATPSCRSLPDSCLLVLHSTTYYDCGYFEQLLRNNGINAVFGYYGDGFPDRVRSFIGQAHFPLFYWWQPDPLLIELDAARISFPDHFTGCDVKLGQPNFREDAENGTVMCDYGAKTLWKAVSNRVRKNAAEGFYFLKEFIVSADQMDGLLRATIAQGTSEETEMQIACSFLKDNMEMFRSMIPDCVLHPPRVVQDGDLIFDPASLERVPAKVFYTTQATYCFPDGGRPGTADRSDRTITLARRSWATHRVISIVTEVILRDYLGFNVELVYNNRTDQIQVPHEILDGYYDVEMEVWLPSFWDLNAELYSPELDPLVTGEVEVVGLTGYSGRSGLFISREVLSKNPLLDFYKAYQNVSQLENDGVRTYADSRLRELSGGEFPVCDSVTSWCGTGDLEGIWAPPVCEAEPARCIEIVRDYPHHDGPIVEQLVKNLGLEAVVAYYGHDGARALLRSEVGTGKASPFYWWEPDSLLLTLDAVRISFPDFYFGCNTGYAESSPNGSVACDLPGRDLSKIVRASLRTSSPEAYYALAFLALYKDMVNSMLEAQLSRPIEIAVCEWMAENQEQIKVWAPPCIATPLPPDEVRAGDLVFDPEDMLCKPLLCQANAVLRYVAASRTYYCDPCVDGSVPNAWQTFCEACPAGLEVNGTSGQCKPCAPGTFKTAQGTACVSCADGRYIPESGQSACRFCNASSYQDRRGASDCKLCEDVLSGAGTPIHGATSSSFCHCRQGSYLPWNSSRCETCPEGMECPGGADVRNFPRAGESDVERPYPKVLEGYMTIPSEPFKVYECLIKEHCPGGPPGTCAEWRDSRSVACGRCGENAYATDTGCVRCGPMDLLPVILITALGLASVVAVAQVANRNLLMRSSVMLMGIMMAGIVMSALQTLIVFKQIGVDWFEPFDSLFRLLSLISFDLELLRMGCVMGNDEAQQFTLRQLVAPVTVVLLGVVLSIKKQYRPQTVVLNELVNTLGTMFNIFISIIISCVSPLVCYRHPGSSGRSVVGSPATLCNFEDAHAYVVTLGFLACLCVPVPFLALVAFGILRYRRYVRSSLDAQWFLASFRFLFMRFHPGAYYFGAATVVRGVCCCLVPVLLDQPGVQVVVLALIIGLYVIVQQAIRPWRAEVVNACDGFLGFLLLLILLCLAVLTDLNGTQAVPAVAMVGFFGTLVVPCTVTAYTFSKRSFGQGYHLFICHHKADAASQARLLKMLLTAMTGKRIFIDSDDLVELDKLFEIVKTSVKLLLVYLTKDTLARPWCAGEITTNWANNGRVATVKTPSFLQPSAEEAKELHLLVDTTSCNLQEQGVTQEALRLALAEVVVAPAIVVSSSERGSRRYLTIAELVVQNKFGEQPPPPISRIRSSTKLSISLGAVVLCADPCDDESVAATGIISKKIEMQVHSYVEGGVTNLIDAAGLGILLQLQHVDASRACIVLLSCGSLDRITQLAIIVRGMSSPNTVMIPVTLWDFKFPTPNFYKNGLPEMWPDTLGTTVREAQAGITSFFNLIAIALSTMANDSILDTQSEQIVGRVPRHFDKSMVNIPKRSVRSVASSSVSAEPRPSSGPMRRLSSRSAHDISETSSLEEALEETVSSV